MRVVAFGPGRVNLIGEHTDYNGGVSLPFAVEQGVTVTATATPDDDLVTAIAHDFDDDQDRFPVADPGPADGWRAYVRGVVAELARAGHDVRPARLEITGTVPQGSGLSSSAALEVAVALAVLGLAGDAPASEVDRIALARLCSHVENTWAGAQTGLLDQSASLLCREGEALRIDFATMQVAHVPLELGDHTLVTLDSGDQHSHAGSGYNERRSECEAACEALGVEHLSQADPEAASSLKDPLDRRARHVLSENARVEQAVTALHEGDLETVARLLDASHASLRDDYDSSTAKVEETVAALKAAGALGARMVGGGFGGHVLALLPPGITAPDGAHEVAPGPGAHLERA